MCIAIGKPMGQELPSKSISQNCFNNNKDGCGFAYNEDGVVHIKKGYMNFDDFYDALMATDKRVNLKNKGVLIHFRIATHGGVCPEMTHPFPIVDDTGSLQKTEFYSPYAVVHNGVISMTSYQATRETKMSDTAVFVRDYLTLIAENKAWFKRKCNIELIEKLIGSKMAILNDRGEIIHTSGFILDGGILYSNTTYKSYYFSSKTPSVPSYNAPYYNDYDADDEYSDIDKYSYSPSYKQKVTHQLMRVEKGWTVEVDGLDYTIEEDEDRTLYITKDGIIYEAENNETDSYKKDSPYYSTFNYFGLGKFYDANGTEVPFRASAWITEDKFNNGENPTMVVAINREGKSLSPIEEITPKDVTIKEDVKDTTKDTETKTDAEKDNKE